MSQPREFMGSLWEIWIDDLNGELAMEKCERAAAKIEVVEKVEYDKLEAALKRAIEALNFYSSNDHWFGPNIEDGKRLFNKIGSEDCHPVTSPDRFVGGKMARDTLARIEEVLK